MAKYNKIFRGTAAHAEVPSNTTIGAKYCLFKLDANEQGFGTLTPELPKGGYSKAWLTGFSFGISAFQANVKEATEAYFVFQASLDGGNTWATFADGSNSKISHPSRSVPYFWVHPNKVYQLQYSFYGDTLLNNKDILTAMILEAGNEGKELVIRWGCKQRNTNEFVRCWYGGSDVRLRFFYETGELPTISSFLETEDIIYSDEKYYLSPQLEEINFWMNVSYVEPSYITQYNKYEWQQWGKATPNASEESWNTVSSGNLPLLNHYGGGAVNRGDSSWSDKGKLPSLLSFSVSIANPIIETKLSLKNNLDSNQDPHKYRIVFIKETEGNNTRLEFQSSITLERSYNTFNFSNTKAIPINACSTEKLQLGSKFGKSDLNIPIVLNDLINNTTNVKFFNNSYDLNVVIQDDKNNNIDSQYYSYAYLENTVELTVTLKNNFELTNNVNIIINCKPHYPVGTAATAIVLPIELLDSQAPIINDLYCSPGLIADTETGKAIKFYSSTNLQLNPNKTIINSSFKEELIITAVSNENNNIIITNTNSMNTKNLKWDSNNTDQKTLNIQRRRYGDYSTYQDSTVLEIKAIKSDNLDNINVEIYDKNSTLVPITTWNGYNDQNTPQPFKFYDNISLKISGKYLDNNLLNYSLKMVNNGVKQVLGTEGLTKYIEDKNSKIHHIDITIGEIEWLRNVNTILELTLTDKYGQQIIKTGLQPGQLRPVMFNIESFNISSTGYSVNASLTQQQNVDELAYTATFVHPNDQDNKQCLCIFTNDTLTTLNNQLGFSCSNEKLDYTNNQKDSNLIKALENHDGAPPCNLTHSVYFKSFPNCKSTLSKQTNYNFTRVIRELGANENIEINYALGDDRTYLNGSEAVEFEITISDTFRTKPYISNNLELYPQYNYEKHYAPPATFTLQDNQGTVYFLNNLKVPEQATTQQNATQQITVTVPEYDDDGDIIYTINANGINLASTDTIDVAKWSKKNQQIIVNQFNYDFKTNQCSIKIEYDADHCGSASYLNSKNITPIVCVYDETDQVASKQELELDENNTWNSKPVNAYSLRATDTKEFYNFITEVTFKNTAGDTLTIISQPYLVSKLLDLTIRRGRVGINVPQDFNYDVKLEETITNNDGDETTIIKHLTPTLEIHQRESTQIDQLETIKIVSCKNKADDSLGPMIGFYSADNQCYGHISANSGKLLVMTIEEVQNLFNAMTEV